MTTPAPHILKIHSQQMLEGLSLLHPLVLLADASGRIAWMSDRAREHLCARSGAGLDPTGADHTKLLAKLAAHLPHPEQLESLRNDLRESRRADSVRLDVCQSDGTNVTVTASAFLVETKDRDNPHYVVMLRPGEYDDRKQEAPQGAGDLVHDGLSESRSRASRAELPAAPELRAAPRLDTDAAPGASASEFLSGIVDASPDGVIATDRSGFITYANPAVKRLLRRKPAELIGKPIALLIPKTESSRNMLESLNAPWRWDGEELESVDGDGRKIWISVSTRRLRQGGRRASGVVIYFRDITARREMQDALKRKNAELESYVDAVAHDLRSPLVSLLGFTGLLRQDYAEILDQTGHHFLDRVEQAGRTMDSLIHDLLELARIGGTRPSHSLTDPRAVLLQIEAEMKLRLDEQSISLVFPDTPPMLPVEGTLLYQVFSNLVGNAVAHMGECDRPEIRVEITTGEHEYRIVVSDHGRGVPQEDRERIFEPFQTGGGSARTDRRSSGIGLAIVKKIAETHGGRAWLENDALPGARFLVTFPIP